MRDTTISAQIMDVDSWNIDNMCTLIDGGPLRQKCIFKNAGKIQEGSNGSRVAERFKDGWIDSRRAERFKMGGSRKEERFMMGSNSARRTDKCS